MEDEAIVAEALARRLAADGWSVVGTAGSSAQALALCANREPDVVLMDIRLRGEADGVDIANELRDIRGGPAVVFLTAHSDASTLARAKEARPAGYLLKPFSDAQLRVTLETAYHVRQVEEERRAAELARHAVDARLRAVLEHAPDAILAFQPDGLEFHSLSAQRTFGYDAGEMANCRLDDLLDVGALGEVGIESVVEASDLGMLRGRRRDGTTFEARATAGPVEGTALTAVIVRDVTADRAMERQVRDAHRMEAVGRVTASVAHDFNNVLSLIKGYAALLHDAVAGQTELREDVEEILGAVGHGAALTRKLLVYAREEQAGQVCAINGVVRSTTRLLRRLLPPNVELEVVLEDDLPPVQLARTALEQVILNLALNARDAMPDGGVLRLHTRLVDAEQVELRVGDTGLGMSDEVMSRVFEAFYTTKPVGRGTGLGLTIVQAIVREVGGRVALESNPGVGTEIVLALPASADGPPSEKPVSSIPAPDLTGRTVLVVDDEAGIRSVVQRTLGPLAAQVLVAHSGVEALRVAEVHGIDVLIADVVLPDVDGVAVADRLLRRNPTLDVLLITGYPSDVLTGRGPRPHRVLPKPFGPGQLLAALQRLIEGRSDT